ncbi:MAG: phytanoyl-CoA dioxygenase family protein [Gammaproteobacteria bacterium]|nr:phytanoyl-CoA dioxygenase family protein [Gammaproteobacteria bacterium]
MDDYFRTGRTRAFELGNRGPIRFTDDQRLHPAIDEAYRRCGFYVFEGPLRDLEVHELEADLAELLTRAPAYRDSAVEAQGRPALAFGKPLSDPYGGTDKNYGRHPAKMSEPEPAQDAPKETLYFVYGIFQGMDACLRLYGHPDLLRVAEAINGPDFVPFADSIWIKEPGLGTSVAWHQDGTTHWNHPRWNEDIHGFNFMAQLCRTTPQNALWVVPGSHKLGKIDIKALVDDAGTDRLPDAVPMLCEPGDVAICNRQALHGSFANTSADRRVSIVIGFHRRDSVLNVKKEQRAGETVVYDEDRIHRRSRVIQLAIDARRSYYRTETPYVYEPFIGLEDDNRFTEATRKTVLEGYHLLNLGI